MSDWRHRSACRSKDPELFFPIGNTGPALAQIEDAKAVCHRCPVIDECLAWALETNQDAGVWGGMDEEERRVLKRAVSRASTRYGHSVRATAVARFRELRPAHPSDWQAAQAVAGELNIGRFKTVLAWAQAGGATAGPGRKTDPEVRAHAVALVEKLRPHHRSEHAACAAVADRVGVHRDTVAVWVREARAAAARSAKVGAGTTAKGTQR